MDGWIYSLIEGGSKQDFGYRDTVDWSQAPSKHLLHTTEGSSWPGYGGGSKAPHFTIDPKNRKTRQHFPITEGSRALQYHGHGTNSKGAIQYEIIGYAKDSQDWRDADYQYIAHVLTAVGDVANIPARCTVEFKNSAGAYGTQSSTRLTYSEWDAYKGILGHQHVPDNAHWDPGMLDVERLLGFMGTVEVSKPIASVPPKINKPAVASSKLSIDGFWGGDTTEDLQNEFNTFEDGEVWHQNIAYRDKNPGLSSGFKWESYAEAKGAGGSPLIKAMQKRMIADGNVPKTTIVDGILGDVFVGGLMKRYGFVGKPELWAKSPTIKAMQAALNAGKF